MTNPELVGFPIAKIIVSRSPWYGKAKKDLKRKGKAAIGGWTLTTGGGGWTSSGGFSSGGGFSGGSGSSGGGGASGSW